MKLAASSRGVSNLQRRAPLLVWFSIAMAVLVVVLPSALNLPQSNPNTVPEFAPVPSDQGPQLTGGNFSSLGVASGPGVAGSQPLDELLSGAASRRPTTKRCVGKPPRQADDLMSPPCVPHFEGSNGGATYRGVSENEITVVVVFDDGNYSTPDGNESSPPDGSYCDVDLPQNAGGEGCYVAGQSRDHSWIRWVRAFSSHFNLRYQTYNRRVHFWVYWSGASTVEEKRAAAAQTFDRLQPFAALDQTFSGNKDAFLDAMARRGVVLLTGQANLAAGEPRPASFFQRYAPNVYSYPPDVERWAAGHASYLCAKVAPFRVSHAEGGIGLNGMRFNERVRKYGFISSADPAYPGVKLFAQEVKDGLKECGITPSVEVTYPSHGMNCCFSTAQANAASDNMLKMKQNDVTTLLWLGGGDFYHSQAADQVKYYPEVVYSGDGSAIERNYAGRLQNQNFFRNAWTTSYMLRVLAPEKNPAWRACQEADSSLSRASCDYATQFYRDYFMLFTGIQVAGPRLTPAAIDRGLHTIPRISSSDPDRASVFFEPGDYSYVKDMMEEWWDVGGRAEGVTTPGCFRMVRDGRRYLPGEWPKLDEAFGNPNDLCNGLSGGGMFETP